MFQPIISLSFDPLLKRNLNFFLPLCFSFGGAGVCPTCGLAQKYTGNYGYRREIVLVLAATDVLGVDYGEAIGGSHQTTRRAA